MEEAITHRKELVYEGLLKIQMHVKNMGSSVLMMSF